MNRLPKLPKNKLEKAMDAVSPMLKKKCDEADEMVKAIGKEMMEDQVKWLDEQMKDLLPPKLYEAGKNGEMESLIGAYLEKHRIRIIFIPDRLVLRIMLGDKVHSQFVPNLTVDGEKMDWQPASSPFNPEKN